MVRLALSLLLVVSLGSAAAGQAGEPKAILDLYQSILTRGDTQGALGLCALPAGVQPDALAEYLRGVQAMAAETDVAGVARALALFVPTLTGPVTRTVANQGTEGGQAWVECETSAPLAFREKVFFVQVDGGWRIDLVRTLMENARGTKIESVVTSIDQQAECVTRMRQLSVALGRYMDEHGQRLPKASEWVAAAKAYLQDPAALSCPSAAGGAASIAMNGQLSALRGVDIAAPEKTVLLFDSQPGVSVGTDESAMARRHNHLATVLLASGAVVTVDSTATLKWTPGTTPSASPSGGITRPVSVRNGVEYVVLRDIVEPLGGRVSWNAPTKTITAALLGRTLDVTDGQVTAMLDGAALPLSAPPITIDGKLLVPVSAISRAYGLWTRWSDGQVTVTLGQH